MIATVFLIMMSLYAFAPVNEVLYLERPDEINYYDRLINAVAQVESKGNIFAMNWKELAAGPLQIRPVRINHYNKLTGSNYTIVDCFDLELSRKVFLYFCQGKSYSQAAKDWNGSGPMTIDYWNLVKAEL